MYIPIISWSREGSVLLAAEAMSNYYKLYFFDSRGDAEVIRIIFAQADVKYRDFRFEGDQWMNEYKASK